MSDQDKKKLNTDALLDVKSLIKGTPPGQYSLEDILDEYGTGRWRPPSSPPPLRQEEAGLPSRKRQAGAPPRTPEPDLQPEAPVPSLDLPWPEAPRPARRRDGEKVLAFPGGQRGAPVQAPPEPPEEAPEPEPEQPAEVIPFPEGEGVLSAFLKGLGRRADDYADQMFAEDEATDPEEVRRLERLIPGTDREEPEQAPPPSRPRRQEPPPPDTPPQELAQRYGRGLKGMRVRALLVFLLALLSAAQLLAPVLGLAWPPPLDSVANQRWIAAGLLGAGVLLGIDVLAAGLVRAFRLRVGMDTLAALACLFTLADGILLACRPHHPSRLPYTAAVLTGLFFLLHGTYHKRCGLRLSCRTAAASAAPYRVTLDQGRWNGRAAYVKWPGDAQDFGSQIQADDGAQRTFSRVCPLLLLADVLLACLAVPGSWQPEQLAWGLSALFTATAAFGGSLVYGRPFHQVARRLAQSGAALAGWPGIADSRRGDRVLVTDADLFPPGYVELNGYKVMGGFPAERVVAYTATLIRDSGSGLAKLFHDQLRAMGGLMRHGERLAFHEGGGLSATIRGDQVLVGSAAFMNLMEISLPQGLNVKSAVFCAINGELAGIFALSYTLPDTVFPALEELIRQSVGPVLATRDFNLIPAMLQQRFRLAADRMDFPPVERRRELSDPGQPHGGTLIALLCREGLFPFAEAITAANRLRRAARLGAALCCVGSLLGLLLAAYLVSVSAYTSLSPLNLLVFLLTWLAPAWFLSGAAHHY